MGMIFRDASRSPRERAEDLLSRLSIKEKAGQLCQRLLGFSVYDISGGDIELTREFEEEVENCGGLGFLYGLYRADPWSGRDFSTGLSGAMMKKAYNKIQRYVIEHSRFGIPVLMDTESPHGHQALDGYLLPVNLAIGATWNPKLAREAFSICGRQEKELGMDFALVSMLDVLRDPRWGRSEECYSEDPYLCSRFAQSAVLGYLDAGMPTVAKHFCAQGECTGGVNASAARIGERELREIHLPAMKAGSDAGALGVMAAYNEIDGTYCCANPHLLREILRTDIGFGGIVMADGLAIDRLDNLTGSPAASAALALSSGVDVGCWDRAYSHLEEAVQKGLVSEKILDEAVLRVLERKFAQGLFEHPYLSEEPPRSYSYDLYPQSLELARQGAVLLKNDGTLPLSKGKKLAVIGPNADSVYNQLGDYTPPQRDGVCVTVLSGLRGKMGAENVLYKEGCKSAETSGFEEAISIAKESDAVILVLGGSSSRFSGAGFDKNGAAVADSHSMMDCGEGVDSSSLKLPGTQEDLAKRIFSLGKPVVTVIIAGRPYAIPKLSEKSSALLYSFYPGPMGGKAIAEILLGDISPSGRLPASLPRSAGQLPCYYNSKDSYPAMRYSDEKEGALYPFGMGLSYTRFEISGIEFPGEFSIRKLETGERAAVRFRIKNAGDMDAYAVPQLFIHGMHGSTVRRVKELKAFDKIFLRKGEEMVCSLSLGREELSVWDRSMRFSLEEGEVELLLEEGGTLFARGKMRIIK